MHGRDSDPQCPPYLLAVAEIAGVGPDLGVLDYDVIHANFPTPYLAAASGLLARARRIPGVLTWHNDLPPVTRGAGVLVHLHDAFSPAYLRFYRSIIATTEAYLKSSPTLRRHLDKVKVIPNGVNTGRFNPRVAGDAIKEKYGLGGCTVGLFVGALSRYHTYKGLDVLIRAFGLARMGRPELRLLLVGEGELKGRYVQLARDLGLSEAVVFAGYVTEEDLPAFYAAADFAVLPSKNGSEGYGLTLLEAMASGKAVIGSRVGGIVDVIQDGINGLLVEPSNPQLLADAMGRMCPDEPRMTMGKVGRRMAEKRDWYQTVVDLERLYREIGQDSAGA